MRDRVREVLAAQPKAAFVQRDVEGVQSHDGSGDAARPMEQLQAGRENPQAQQRAAKKLHRVSGAQRQRRDRRDLRLAQTGVADCDGLCRDGRLASSPRRAG